MPDPLKIAFLGAKVLQQVAAPIAVEQIPAYRPLAQQMVEKLESYGNRVGLAAPQVHHGLQMLVYRIPASVHPRYKTTVDGPVPMTVMFNPRFVPLSDEVVEGWEGCISIPDLIGVVPRYRHIRVNYHDLDGEARTVDASNFHARVLQHEIDHLNGIVYLERIKDLKNLGYESELLSGLD